MLNIIIIRFPCWPAYQQGHPDNNSTIRNWQHLSLAVVVVAPSNWFSITERQDICHNTQQRWMDRLIVIICTNSYNMIMHLNASLPFPVCACPWLGCHGGDTLNRREDQTKYTSFPVLRSSCHANVMDEWKFNLKWSNDMEIMITDRDRDRRAPWMACHRTTPTEWRWRVNKL